jgi:hypothetical protein
MAEKHRALLKIISGKGFARDAVAGAKALIAVAFSGTADLSRRAVEAVPFVRSLFQQAV